MIRQFFIFVTITLVTLSSAAQQSDFDKMISEEVKGSVPYIYPQELYDLLASGNSPHILDTRNYEEYNTSYIEGAVHVGFAGFSPKKINAVKKDEMIVVYCTIGARSETIGEKLIKKGYAKVFNLYGGIIHWVNEGYPVYKDEITLTKDVHVYSKSWGSWLRKGNPVF